MKYSDYLQKISDRVAAEAGFICNAIRADRWHNFSINAWRLKREVNRMLKLSQVILNGPPVGTIIPALRVRYPQDGLSTVALRQLWLADLSKGANKCK